MGIIASAKGELIKGFLSALTHGDTGSTILGSVAAAILLSGVNLSDLFSSDQTKKMQALGLLGGAVVVGAWGYFIGKKTPTPEK